MSTVSLLKTLMESSPPTEAPAELELQGRHAFAAVRHLIDRIKEVCTEEEAEDLIKRFFNAAKSDDFRKFRRGIRRLAEKDDVGTGSEEDTSAEQGSL